MRGVVDMAICSIASARGEVLLSDSPLCCLLLNRFLMSFLLFPELALDVVAENEREVGFERSL